MAMSRLSSTTILITEYVPNMSMSQNRVKILIPSKSKLSRSTRPNTAQNNVCVVSKRLQMDNDRKTHKNRLINVSELERGRTKEVEKWPRTDLLPTINTNRKNFSGTTSWSGILTWRISATLHTHWDLWYCWPAALSNHPSRA